MNPLTNYNKDTWSDQKPIRKYYWVKTPLPGFNSTLNSYKICNNRQPKPLCTEMDQAQSILWLTMRIL